MKDREAGQIRQAATGVGLNWDENLRLWQRDKELWLFPVGIEALIGKVRFSRLGIKLAETHNKGYRWQHEAVIALASPDNECIRADTAGSGGVVSRARCLPASRASGG